MPAISFPSSPATNQVFASGTSAWQWDGTAWRVVRNSTLNGQLAFGRINFYGATLTDPLFTVGSINTDAVLINSPQRLTNKILGACTVDETNNVGFRNIPQNAQSSNYTLILSDAGKHIYSAAGNPAYTVTIPAASSVAFPIGTAVTFVNLSANAMSIAITTDTLYYSGSTGTRTLAQYGIATAIKVSGVSSSGIWVMNGTGIT